jgi:hypothetical protein
LNMEVQKIQGEEDLNLQFQLSKSCGLTNWPISLYKSALGGIRTLILMRVTDFKSVA